MATPARQDVPGQVDRPWTEDDVATFSQFLVRNKWTLQGGGTSRACHLFQPPRSVDSINNMCKGLKARRADRWKQYWMPLGEIHSGRQGRLLDSLPTQNCEASNVLSATVGSRTWTVAQMTATNEFHEARKAGSMVTKRAFVEANQGLGLCVKQVSSCCRHVFIVLKRIQH